MKGKRLLSLVISAAMTLTTFSGLAMTSASAAVGDVANEIWNAATYDGAIIADTALYEGDKGTLTTKFDMTKYTTYTENEAEVPVSETVGERTFTAYYSHPSMNGGYNTGGTYRDGYMTLFTFTPKSDGVMTLYLRNVGSNKSVAILKEGATNYKAISTDGGTTGSIVWQTGTGASASYSAQLTANTTYLMFVDGSKGQFMAVDYEVGATYEQATPPPATPAPTHDPNAKSWTVSANDIGIKAGTTLMVGLTTLFDNTSTNDKYISGADNGKIDKNAATPDAVVTGTALKFAAPENGRLEVTMIDVGSENADGTIKQVTPVIFDLEALQDVFSYTNTKAKEEVPLWADVEEGKTYYITATGTKGRFSAAKFTPASEVTSTDTPSTDATDTPSTDATDAPSTSGITYAGGTVTVTLDNTTVTNGVLLHAKYDGAKLASVKSYDLAFTNGVAEKNVEGVENGDKLMVWDSLSGMKPLCPAYTVGSSVTPGETTAPGENTPAPDDDLPDDILWRADDTAFDNVVAGAAETVKGLTATAGFGLNNKKVVYTHTDGTAYTFTRQWKHGSAEQTLTFTPAQACIVTVVFNGNGGAGREVNIKQNGTLIAAETSVSTATNAAEVVVADIEDPTAGDVVIGGGGSNKNISAIFVEYYDPTVIVKRNVSGNITHVGSADTSNAKIVFTDTKDNTRYEVPVADTYSVDLRQNRNYDITVEVNGEETEDLVVALTTNSISLAKLDKTFDIIIADVASTQVAGDVVVHDVNNDGSSLDLSGVTLTFTSDDVIAEADRANYTNLDAENHLVYTTGITNKKLNTEFKLLPNHTYNVTATGIEGYTLSPLSQTYTMVAGDITPFKNILFNETLGDVTFASTIQVGANKAYATVSDAITAIKAMTNRPAGEAGRVTVQIDPGTYVEQVIVDAPYVTLKAADETHKPTITFYYGIGYMYYSADGGYYSMDKAVQKTELGPVTRWGSTVRVAGANFIAENIIFENSLNCRVTDEELADGVTAAGVGVYGDVSGKPDRTVKDYDAKTKNATERCAAFAGDAANYEIYNCELIGSQDTLYTGYNGYFKNCYIEGGTDYIFGGNSVVFEGCTLAWHGYSDQEIGGYITACKTSAAPVAGTADINSNGYLFKNCTVTNSKYYTDNKFAAGSWGRNWGGANCQVVFDGITLSGVDTPGAWVKMGGELSTSILYVNNVTDKTGKAVDTSSATFNPNGTMATNNYTVMDPTDYFGTWTPVHYEGVKPTPTEYKTTWYFGKSNGAADYPEASVTNIHEIEGENNAETTQTMIVDKTNGGKLSNEGRNDEWANVGTGTKMTIPVVKGSVISFGSYQNGGEITINGTVVAGTGTYTVTEDVKTIEITVSKGGYMSYVRTTTPAANGKPADYVPPVLSGTVNITGDVKFGSKVTASVADANVDGLKYQWQANTGAEGAYVDITGATSAEYTIAADYISKTLKCVVTSDKATGSISKETAAVAKATMTGSVTIGGTVKEGETVTATISTNAGTDYTIQWQASTGTDGAYEAIAGATSASYQIPVGYAGKTLKCVVTSTSTTVDGSIASEPSTEVAAKTAVLPDITGTVSVTGNAVVGQTLIAKVDGLNAGATAQYQWKAKGESDAEYVNIADSTDSNTYTINANLVGKKIKCVVTTDKTTGEASSAATEAVVLPDIDVSGTITLTGQSKGSNNGKNDTYSMTGSDYVLKFKEQGNETAEAVTARVNVDAATTYSVTLAANKTYDVTLGDTLGNVYSITSGQSVQTQLSDVEDANIAATKTYAIKFDVRQLTDETVISYLNTNNITTLYAHVDDGATAVAGSPVAVSVEELKTAKKEITVKSVPALNTSGSTDNYYRAYLSTSETKKDSYVDNYTVPTSNQQNDIDNTSLPFFHIADLAYAAITVSATGDNITGESGSALTSSTVDLKLTGSARFNTAVNDDVTSWFSVVVDESTTKTFTELGLTATATTVNNANATITIGGTPNAAVAGSIKVAVPADQIKNVTSGCLKVTSIDKQSDITVTVTTPAVPSVGTVKIALASDESDTEISTVLSNAEIEAIVNTTASNVTYKWYQKAKDADDFALIDSQTAATYTVPSDTALGTVIKVVVSATGCTDIEASVTVTVNPQVADATQITATDTTVADGACKDYAYVWNSSATDEVKAVFTDPAALTDKVIGMAKAGRVASATFNVEKAGTYKVLVLGIEYNNRYYTANVDGGSEVNPTNTNPGIYADCTENGNGKLTVTEYQIGDLTAGSHTVNIKATIDKSRDLFAIALVPVID